MIFIYSDGILVTFGDQRTNNMLFNYVKQRFNKGIL